MKMEKFTKGPWLVKGDWMITDSSDRLIAQFEPLNDEISNSNTPESFANAALIAAAPEMYEMLVSIRQCLGFRCTNNELVDTINERSDELDDLLAKARGEK